ncbi:MAG: SMC family ATPase [Lachnospiraceae bacterium]|nr:SMC family ATPase [Lachnospiraceae bacterium]
MRPKYLEMSAWGPYKDVVKVDFEAFDKGALFLITGPTGSGKTTIFDGICFAIYGNTSGKEREKNTLRSDFANPDTRTYVKFIFTHNGQMYEVERNPEYMRPKKRKNSEGTLAYTKESEDAKLLLPDGNVIAGVTSVNRRLQELMALDYSQFKQISMIAQGEFDKMLTAPSQEKTKIFRGIFGTEKLDLFTQTLKAKAAASYRKVSEYTHRIEEDIKIHAKGEQTLENLAAESYMNLDAIQEEMAARLTFYKEEKAGLKKQLREKEEALIKKQAAYTQALEQRKKQEQLQQAKARYEKLQNTKEQYEATKASLNRAKEAQEITKDYEAYTTAQNEVKKTLEQVEKINRSVEEAREQYMQAEQVAKKTYEAWQQADSAYRRASIGIVADMLLEGQPCPVCGSLEHPVPFQSDGTVPDLKEVERLKKVHDKEKDKQMTVYGQVQAVLEAKRKALEEECEAKDCLAKQQEAWQVQLEKSSFAEETEFLQARLPKATELKYQEQVKKWEDMVVSTLAVVEHLTEELSKVTLLDAEAIEADFKEAQCSRDEVRNREQQVLLKEARMKEGLVSLKENRGLADTFKKEYGIIKDLENMATGNNAKRLVFEQYVLSSYFEDILAAANVRFRHMTMDRYEMIRKTEVSDARTKDHLDIMIVDYYTGKTRPVSTLSGGERFNASLSLALGMSDVIQAYQGGIQVETLFVDEGFGSLDEETLQAACDTLYQLTQGDKLVGIISHVESLKQRIDNRIEICKTNMGSTLNVVTQI